MASFAAKTCIQILYQSFKKIVAIVKNKLGQFNKCFNSFVSTVLISFPLVVGRHNLHQRFHGFVDIFSGGK